MGGVGIGNFCLKTAHGKYLSSDKFGSVSIFQEAAGCNELWYPEMVQDKLGVVVFKSGNSSKNDVDYKAGYLKLDNLIQTGLRADSENREDATEFYIMCQTSCRKKRESDQIKKALIEEESEKERRGEGTYSANYELDQMRRYMSWIDGRQHRDEIRLPEEKNELEKAATEGRFHSVLLERRTRMKSDKYCK